MHPATRFLAPLVFTLGLNLASAQTQPSAPTGLKLPAIISDHMVLQADQPDPIWGWAPTGTAVQVEFVNAQNKTLASAQAVADASGKWSANLSPLTSGTAGELHVAAATGAPVVVHDVLVGEDWLCGGQSNMTYTIKSGNTPPEMLALAQKEATDANGAIRYFTAGTVAAPDPRDDVTGRWQIGTPGTVGGCSAVAWNFAVALREKLHSPMGLVVSCVGGTQVELWIPKQDLDTCPVGPAVEKRYTDAITSFPDREKKFEADDAAWLATNPTPELQTQNKSKRPGKPGMPNMVCQFYNGMIHGLEPFGVKGVIWFQADGNLGDVPEYGDMIKSLILAWRRCWQAELPFYYVEMNNMRDMPQKNPVQYNGLSILREQQEAALELPKTEVACSIDVGLPVPEPHFPNKKPVGQRLALLALNAVYGQPCAAHSPELSGVSVEGNKLRLQFKYGEGLRARGDGKILGFAIRGATGNWVWAEGKIDGNDMLLWSDKIPQPAAARYAWAMNPITSMENGAGLPLRPFRTDKTSPQ